MSANNVTGISVRGLNKIIPSPRGLPGIGTMLSIIAAGGASRLHLYVDSRHKQLGGIYREQLGPVSGVFVSDADYMRKVFASEGKYPRHVLPESWLLFNEKHGCKRGLLFMDGEEWYRCRKSLNGVFLKPKNEDLVNAVDVVAQDLVEKWRHEGTVTDLEKQLYRWSIEVILAVLLGSDEYKQRKNDLFPHVANLARTVHNIFVESGTLSLMSAKLASKLRLPVWRRFVEAARSAVDTGNDMVDLILPIAENSAFDNGLLKKLVNSGIGKEDLCRIVTDLILAAGDTSANTMQWLLHLLSLEPEIQDQICQETNRLKLEQAVQSSLLKGVLRETLRLYPVAPFIARYMPEHTVIDGYPINAGQLVIMSLYSSGRNEIYFPQPEKFLPERWTRRSSGYQGVNNPYASLPFAMGARSCIGKKIAETQILITVSKIVNNFQIRTDKKKRADIILHLISVPSEPIGLTLVPR